jgi:hypothetical protein
MTKAQEELVQRVMQVHQLIGIASMWKAEHIDQMDIHVDYDTLDDKRWRWEQLRDTREGIILSNLLLDPLVSVLTELQGEGEPPIVYDRARAKAAFDRAAALIDAPKIEETK